MNKMKVLWLGNPNQPGKLGGLWVVLILCLGLLAACGGETTPTSVALPTRAPTATATANTGGFPVPINPKIAALPPLELNVWFADDYYNQPPFVDMFKEFMVAYPNVKIKVDHSEWDAMKDKVKQTVANLNFNVPDLVHQHSFAFGAQGYAEPLNDLWRDWATTSPINFLPGAIEDVTWNANFYGVPLDINTLFLFYNKAMFKEAGLPEPGPDYTYPKLLEDAKKLTKPEQGVYGVAVHNGAWNVYGNLRSVGGHILTQSGGQQPTVQLADQNNIQMMEFLSDLVNKYKVSPMPPADGRYDPVNLFMEGKVAMFFSGPWDLTTITQKGPKGMIDQVGTAGMPRGFDGKPNGTVQGGGSMFVPKRSKNREVAFELMKWAVSPKYQLRMAKEMGRYPVLADMYKDPYFTGQPLLQPYLKLLSYSHPYELEAYDQGDAEWQQVIKEIINQGKDARTVLQAANRTLDTIIRQS